MRAQLNAAPLRAQVVANAENLKHDVQSLKGESDELKTKAANLEEKSEDLRQEVEAARQEADDKKDGAKQAKTDAADLREKAEEMQKQAQDLIRKAAEMEKQSVKKTESVSDKIKKLEKMDKKIEETRLKGNEKEKAAIAKEEDSLNAMGDARMCVRLPGVKLRGDNPMDFRPLLGEHPIEDEWQCTDWCQKHDECKQAVFTWESKTCEMFGGATEDPLVFRDKWPFFNSSYCGGQEEKDDMLGRLDRVYQKKPWAPPAHNCSWAGDNCLYTGCCADVCKATWDFKTCKWYTCWKRDESWAGCELEGAPDGWDGTKLGGHPNTEVPPAAEGALTQGVRLYCFSVVVWGAPAKEAWMSSEAEITNHWKDAGRGICLCDDWSIFDGMEGGSVHNIASFINAWNQVKNDGRWKNNDWSIKVDPDAVFFPDHFRSKVQWVWRTPQGAPVYMRNTKYKFEFLGAIEAITKEAMEIYFERSWECEAHLGEQGGEDYWLLQCLEGLGINYQTDHTLLHDKYAADENCKDPNGVAHHFFKKISDWDKCWDAGWGAWEKAHPQ